jgi:hypothetical protein
VKFFVDTANLDELRTGVSSGIVDGATTNRETNAGLMMAKIHKNVS